MGERLSHCKGADGTALSPSRIAPPTSAHSCRGLVRGSSSSTATRRPAPTCVGTGAPAVAAKDDPRSAAGEGCSGNPGLCSSIESTRGLLCSSSARTRLRVKQDDELVERFGRAAAVPDEGGSRRGGPGGAIGGKASCPRPRRRRAAAAGGSGLTSAAPKMPTGPTRNRDLRCVRKCDFANRRYTL